METFKPEAAVYWKEYETKSRKTDSYRTKAENLIKKILVNNRGFWELEFMEIYSMGCT